MRFIVAMILALALSVSVTGCFTTMEDCCECLAQSGGIECNDPHEECVAACFDLCEPTRACYCSDARRVGCEEECGCIR